RGGRTDALHVVKGCSEEELRARLAEATEAGLVSQGEDGYAFRHDRIREAAYALVPESERQSVHLRIGRLMLANLNSSEVTARLFDIVYQLNKSPALASSLLAR